MAALTLYDDLVKRGVEEPVISGSAPPQCNLRCSAGNPFLMTGGPAAIREGSLRSRLIDKGVVAPSTDLVRAWSPSWNPCRSTLACRDPFPTLH